MMNTLKMFKYSFYQNLKGYGIFIAIIAAIIHIVLIISVFSDGEGGLGGMEISTFIFMFALGAAVFKENFHLSVQSGISRKSFFAGTVLSSGLMALIGGIVDTLIAVLCNTYEKYIDKFSFDCMYEQFFKGIDMDSDEKILLQSSDIFKVFLMNFTAYLAFILIGFFIGAAFYRLSKKLKFIIPIAIYIVCMILRFVDYILFDYIIMRKLSNAFIWVMKSNWHLAIFLPIVAVVFSAGAFLFTRRMGINEKA